MLLLENLPEENSKAGSAGALKIIDEGRHGRKQSKVPSGSSFIQDVHFESD